MLPELAQATKLNPQERRLFIGAYGFEDRSSGWLNLQERGEILTDALMFRYRRPKGKNRRNSIRKALERVGAASPIEVTYDYSARFPGNIEEIIDAEFVKNAFDVDEIVVDISSMSKLLILLCLCKLSDYSGKVRIVYSEAEDYSPSEGQYKAEGDEMGLIATYPSQGVESIIRTKCLSSIRMQGQPVTLIAFCSFNEQLVRQMLGGLSPHRLIFINGKPPRRDYVWREYATQQIHERLIQEYAEDNPQDATTGLLLNTTSTLAYKETVEELNRLYSQLGLHERIVCAATGSKMQTVGLFFYKIYHPDIHIEYPTPNSYFVEGMTQGIRTVHEICFLNFSAELRGLQTAAS